jgi:elongation factor G
MAKRKTPEKIDLTLVRNIGVAAHIDAGKTTLTERILFYTGVSHKIGEVHDGAATMDFMAEEKAHGITIGSAVTRSPWNDHLIQLVDTPGHVDFTIEVERAMRVLDGAIIVMDAVRGVEPQTETVWRQASRFDIPRIVFVNKMDRPGASYERSMASLEKRLGGHPVPVCVPLEDGRVIDLVNREIVSFSGDRGQTVTRGPVPEDLQDLLENHRETMLLAAAEFDEVVEEAVMMDEEVDVETIWGALRKGVMSGQIHAFFGGSALRNWGVQPLLDAVLKLLPNPLERPPAIAHTVENGEPAEEILVDMTPDGSLAALAFKVQLWEGRRHVFIRIYRGQLHAGDQVRLGGRGEVERVARIFQVDAGHKKRVESATAGEIILLAGLRKATTGDTLCHPDEELLLERIDTKEPVLGLAIEPESGRDEEKMLDVLAKICEEDPTVRFAEDPDTGQRVLKGMGELHLQIIFERIEREFGVKIRAGKPRVMIRETIAGAGSGDATVDRVLRAGEPNEMRLRARASAKVSPRGRDAGMHLTVEPRILPAGLIPSPAQLEAIQAGVQDATLGGPAEGAPLQDVDVKLTTVEFFGEHSSPMALRIATSQAVREALVNGGSQVLRPLMTVAVVSPDENLGTVLGDLQARGASIHGQVSDMGVSTVSGECPLQALLGYATELRSLTKGRGQFTMDFARFDVG